MEYCYRPSCFYFQKFLPAVASHFVVKTTNSGTSLSSLKLKDCGHQIVTEDSASKVFMQIDSHKFDNKASKTDTCVNKQVNSQSQRDLGKAVAGMKNHDTAVKDLQLVAVYTKPPVFAKFANNFG